MKNRLIAGILAILAVVLVFLTPFFPFDEAVIGIVAIIVGMLK